MDVHIGHNISLSMSEKATVVISSYSERRMRNIQPLVRSVLKCDFVEKVIVSNHNPQSQIEDFVKVDDSRVMLVNQPVRRSPGYRWIIASKEPAYYFIIIDDDVLISPKQLAVLFQRLVEQPEVPHGLAGCCPDGTYVTRQEREVAGLYNIYAVTRAHVQTYLEYTAEITTHGYASQESIEYWGDDIIISRTGRSRPRIHEAGFVLFCKTHDMSGVALWKEKQFEQRRRELRRILEKPGLNKRNAVE
ncbi:glycosyltransferase family A protein [Candidatus Latescibacterota bacterium]